MGRTIKKLTAVQVNNIKKPGIHALRDRLYLQIKGCR